MADFVLIDAPPLLTTSDAADLARQAEAVLLVVRAGRTSVDAARRSVELLERLGIPVLGAVLIGSDGLRFEPSKGSKVYLECPGPGGFTPCRFEVAHVTPRLRRRPCPSLGVADARSGGRRGSLCSTRRGRFGQSKRETPNVLDGKVTAILPVGGRIIVGGTFSQVQEVGVGKPVLNRRGSVRLRSGTGVVAPGFVANFDVDRSRRSAGRLRRSPRLLTAVGFRRRELRPAERRRHRKARQARRDHRCPRLRVQGFGPLHGQGPRPDRLQALCCRRV